MEKEKHRYLGISALGRLSETKLLLDITHESAALKAIEGSEDELRANLRGAGDSATHSSELTNMVCLELSNFACLRHVVEARPELTITTFLLDIAWVHLSHKILDRLSQVRLIPIKISFDSVSKEVVLRLEMEVIDVEGGAVIVAHHADLLLICWLIWGDLATQARSGCILHKTAKRMRR